MQISMNLIVEFNREVEGQKDNISPGGFEMVMNGKNVKFDFCHSKGFGFGESSEILFMLNEVDYDSFPEFEKITVNDLENISEIKDCFVYVGEPQETDLKVCSIKNIIFLLENEEPHCIEIPKEVIAEFNKTFKKEGSE